MELEKLIKSNADESGNIPAAHIAALVTAIKQAVGQEFVERSRYNERLTEIESLKTEVKKAEEKAASADQLQLKYDAVKAEFKDYKAGIKQREEYDAKAAKFREVLTAAGVPAKYQGKIVEVSTNVINGIELDENGAVKGVEQLTDKAKTDWGDFIPVVTVSGTAPAPVLGNNTAGRKYTSKDEIMQIKDTRERQAAIAANMDLFKHDA